METVTISASINKNKETEFFQTMESLKALVKSYCNDFEIIKKEDGNTMIKIIFNRKEELENNFNNKEFNILKGTINSLCDNVVININGINVNSSLSRV